MTEAEAPNPPIPPRTLSAADVARELDFSKEGVLKWARPPGVGGSICPHSRGGTGHKPYLFNLDEVRAWRKSVGLEEHRTPLLEIAQKDAAAAAKEEPKSRVEDRPMSDEEMLLKLRQQAAMLNREISELDADSGSLALAQLFQALKSNGAEIARIEKAIRERQARDRTVLDRAEASAIVQRIAETARSEFDRAAIDVAPAVRLALFAAYPELAAADPNRCERVVAAAVAGELSAALARIAQAVRAAADAVAPEAAGSGQPTQRSEAA